MQRPGEGIPAHNILEEAKPNDGTVLFYHTSPKDDTEKFILKYLMGFFDSSKETYIIDGKEEDRWSMRPEGKYKHLKKNKTIAQKWVDEYIEENNIPEKRPFAEEMIRNIFDESKYYYEDKPTFKLQTQTTERPTFITSQLAKVWWDDSLQPTAGNCAQASMNNACQKYITDFETLKKHGSQTSGPEEGIRTSTVKSYLEQELGFKVKESEYFPKYVDLTKTKAAFASYSWHPSGVAKTGAHAVAIRDGWMVDSNFQPYPFKGRLEGYLGYGEPKLQKVYQIKTRKNVFPEWTGMGGIDPVPTKYARAPTFLTKGRDRPY